MKFSNILFFTLCTAILMGQSTFKKSFHPDGGIPDAISTLDGGFALLKVGGFPGIIKTDKKGITEWTVGLESNATISAHAIAQNTEGDYFLFLSSNATQLPQMTIVKVSNSGNFIRASRFFSTPSIEGWDMISDNAGGVLFIGGGYRGYSFVVRLDDEMNIIFEKGYSLSFSSSASAVTSNDAGNFIICGSASDGQNTNSLFISEIDIDGQMLWSRSYKSDGPSSILSVKQLADGGYAFVGQSDFDPLLGESDMLIARVDGNGELIWSQTIDKDFELLEDLVQSADGSLVVGGRTSPLQPYDGTVGRVDLDGKILHLNSFKGEKFNGTRVDVAKCIIPVCEDKFAVFGNTDGASMFFINDKGEGICETVDIVLNELRFTTGVLSGTGDSVIEKSISFETGTFLFTVHSDHLEELEHCNYIDPDEKLCSTVSSNEPSLTKRISIYPNPAFQSINIVTESNTIEAAVIYDSYGQRMKTMLTGFDKVEVSDLDSGIYLIEIETSKEVIVQKFVKQ